MNFFSWIYVCVWYAWFVDNDMFSFQIQLYDLIKEKGGNTEMMFGKKTTNITIGFANICKNLTCKLTCKIVKYKMQMRLYLTSNFILYKWKLN